MGRSLWRQDAQQRSIQKTFDEQSVQVLADALVREMHKMTLTVDMSDEKFTAPDRL